MSLARFDDVNNSFRCVCLLLLCAAQDNFYPKGPSVMFYKMFLDDDVARSFAGYAALAILEWDVVVAHSTSFERLYKAAFMASEEFWVKGSTLTGAEFHGTSVVSEMWHILGHLNGNAICKPWRPLRGNGCTRVVLRVGQSCCACFHQS